MDKDRETRIVLGKQAKDILENDAFHVAMNTVMNRLFADFVSSSAEDTGLRERTWAVAQAANEVRHCLEALVQSGNLDDANKAFDAKR